MASELAGRPSRARRRPGAGGRGEAVEDVAAAAVEAPPE